MNNQDNQEHKNSPLREYEADGIQEYDNPMPKWWKGLFYLTIIFSIGYMLWLHVLGGKSLDTELAEALNAKSQSVKKEDPVSPTAAASDEDLETKLKKPELIAEGKIVYATNCVACHASDGGGGVGPNLTDDYWLHGGDAASVLTSVSKGIVEKGMIGWEPILGKKKVEAVVAYTLSLQGTHPQNPKAPQGVQLKK